MAASTLPVDAPVLSVGFISRLGAWLFRLKPAGDPDLSKLRDAAAYRKSFK